MLPTTSIEKIVNEIKNIQVASNDMKNYLNSLSQEKYASIATIFIIGRSGWERNYYETNEYYSFIEENEACGIKVNQKMLDDKFLTNELKLKQINISYEYELSNAKKIDGVYHHDWLGMKANLIIEIEKGLNMLREVNYNG